MPEIEKAMQNKWINMNSSSWIQLKWKEDAISEFLTYSTNKKQKDLGLFLCNYFGMYISYLLFVVSLIFSIVRPLNISNLTFTKLVVFESIDREQQNENKSCRNNTSKQS